MGGGSRVGGVDGRGGGGSGGPGTDKKKRKKRTTTELLQFSLFSLCNDLLTRVTDTGPLKTILSILTCRVLHELSGF